MSNFGEAHVNEKLLIHDFIYFYESNLFADAKK